MERFNVNSSASNDAASRGRAAWTFVAILTFLFAGSTALAQPADEGSEGAATEATSPDGTDTDEAEPAAPATDEAAAPPVGGAAAPAPEPEAPADEGGLLRPANVPFGFSVQMDEFEAALSLYEEEIGDYRATVNEVVEIEYERRRTDIREFYEVEIDALRLRERERRLAAIEDFERFLQRYPNHPEFTPDVMFRLAELHYEKAADDYNQADDEFQRALTRYEMGIEPDEPEEPAKDFAVTIRLFRDLMARFPDYRQIDGAYYLQGICFDQMDRYAESLANFETLVDMFPDSDFAQEAYLRIGEFYFEEQDFATARAAYERSLSYGESKWFDKILFKLGWSTYLLSEYHDAIGRFSDLLAYYSDQGGAEAALKEEALQYFAISVAEEDWDLDGERDPEFVLPRVDIYLGEDLDYTSEILDRLAQILLENQRYEYSIQVNQHAIQRFVCDPKNLDRSLMIVEAHSQLREVELALAEQRAIGERFGPGTEWYACQERLGNTEALTRAETIVKDNLIETANRYYVQAQETANRAAATGDPLIEQQAYDEFAFAARIYEDFLAAYPDESEVYHMRMYYAQALLYSTQFRTAAEQFGAVRDDGSSAEFREIAAALAIQSYELELEREIDAFRLEGRAWPAYQGVNQWLPEEVEPDDSDEPRAAPVDEPIPDISKAWAQSIDRYLELGLNSETDPNTAGRYAFAAAKLYYDYKHYEDARARFFGILDLCADQPETGYAAGFLIESYRVTGDTIGFREAADQLQGRYQRCVPEGLQEAIAADITNIDMGMLAQRAEELFAAGEYEEAAQEYSRLANEYTTDPVRAPQGLFNSGLIYEQQLNRFELAMQQFERLINEYPDSEFVDDALVRIAVNSKRFFDFDRAISTLLILHDIGFSDLELIEYPRLDAALLMENVGRSREAAEAYLAFVAENPANERAPAILYSAGVLYDDLDDHRRMRDVFDDFRRDYGDAFSTHIDIDAAVIDTFYRSAIAYEEDDARRDARRELDRLLGEYSVRLPEAPAAKFAAAKVIYERAMEEFDDWNDIELGESVEDQTDALEERREGIDPVIAEFEAVLDYGAADWTVCALYMEGRVAQVMADLLYTLPVPDFGDDIDAEDEYVLMVEDFASQYEDMAIVLWEQGYPIMEQLGVTNQCTIDMTTQLNRYRGAQYPVFRAAIEHEQQDLFSPQILVVPEAPQEDEPAMELMLPDEDVEEDPFAGEGYDPFEAE